MPLKIPWINEDFPIELSTSILNFEVATSSKPNRFVNFLVTVMLSIPTSGFENQLPRAVDFDAKWNIRSCYEPFPHDCYDETEHLAKAERRRVPDERRPLRLVKSKRNYTNRLYARESEHEMRIRESFINEMA
uniref:Uncharacterized protein n=1 Tax=Acrobeloides nanus TaxID=290746 RepID=A0A914ELB2_9BILA